MPVFLAIKGGNESQALGPGKGGFTIKIYALADGLRNPVKFILTGGSEHEMTSG